VTEGIQVAMISALPPSLVALFGLIVGLRNQRKIQEVHVLFNSRMTELLKLTASAAHAKGVKAEKGRHTPEI
jgi:hypothetical protein